MYFEFVAAQFADQEIAMFNVTEEGIIFVAENVRFIGAMYIVSE